MRKVLSKFNNGVVQNKKNNWFKAWVPVSSSPSPISLDFFSPLLLFHNLHSTLDTEEGRKVSQSLEQFKNLCKPRESSWLDLRVDHFIFRSHFPEL